MSTSTATDRDRRAEPAWAPWARLVARLVLGGVLVWSGLSKITDLAASAEAVRAFKILPFEVANLLGYVLPVVELALGLLLVLGLFTRVTAAIGALMMIAFTIGIVSVWVRGISIDCGCFGGGGVTSPDEAFAAYPWDIARDLALAACGLWLVLRPATPASLDRLLLGAPRR